MEIFLDTANIDEIREAFSWGIIDGVTTNPSLIAKNGKDFIQTIYEIAELVNGPVSAETIAQDTEGMVREGKLLAQIHPEIVVKIPLTPAGIAATKQLSDQNNISVLATSHFSWEHGKKHVADTEIRF